MSISTHLSAQTRKIWSPWLAAISRSNTSKSPIVRRSRSFGFMLAQHRDETKIGKGRCQTFLVLQLSVQGEAVFEQCPGRYMVMG
jgi:hypothetical protein